MRLAYLFKYAEIFIGGVFKGLAKLKRRRFLCTTERNLKLFAWAGVLAKAPLNEPTAVRAAETITTSVILLSLCVVVLENRPASPPWTSP